MKLIQVLLVVLILTVSIISKPNHHGRHHKVSHNNVGHKTAARLASAHNASCDKAVACETCQKTIYQLKFKYATKCGFLVHCKNTCIKVLTEWSKPGSVFGAFQSDAVGKCDACFRAGFCSANTCQAQKRREEQVITQIVNGQQLSGKKNSPVDQREMDIMVKRVVDNQKVDWERVEHRVNAQVNKALQPGKFAKRKGEMAMSLRQAIQFGLAKK